MQTKRYLTASTTLLEDIDRVAYAGQSVDLRRYHTGYEDTLNCMPILDPADRLIDGKIGLAKYMMTDLATQLHADPFTKEDLPGKEGFTRTILAIQAPEVSRDGS